MRWIKIRLVWCPKTPSENISYVVCNNELSTLQYKTLSDLLKVPVIDRTMIVLEIFSRSIYFFINVKNFIFYFSLIQLIDAFTLSSVIKRTVGAIRNELSTLQYKTLSDLLKVPVIDRTMIVLEIFSRNARTKESKLQVQVALMRSLSSRINMVNASEKSVSDRSNGAFYNRGKGESIYESGTFNKSLSVLY